jgi:hypothetical protein
VTDRIGASLACISGKALEGAKRVKNQEGSDMAMSAISELEKA